MREAPVGLEKEEREQLLDRVEARATALMVKHGGCGQCVLLALQEELNLPGGADAVKAAGFTNLGVARLGNICGALMGSIMAMGLASGRGNLDEPLYPSPEEVDDVYFLPKSLLRIREFYYRFVQEFGSWSCRDLQVRIFGRSFETVVMDEEEEFHKAGGHLRCVDMVGRTARLAAETILDLPRR
jgi:C_GCAxxG_C_C family probable redox protein